MKVFPATISRVTTIDPPRHLTDNDRQPLLEYDVLVLGYVDLAGLLEDLVVRPPGVDGGQLGGDPVVLSHEQRVEDDQVELLVDPEVSSKEAVVLLPPTDVAAGHFPLGLPLAGGEVAVAAAPLPGDLQFAPGGPEIRLVYTPR